MNFIKTLIIFQSIIFLFSCNTFAENKSTLDSGLDVKSGIHYILNKHQRNKPYILFIHGTPGDRRAFKEYLEDPEIAQKYNMVSIDRLGFGESFSKESIVLFKEHSRTILNFLNNEFPKIKFSCVAHSYGSPLCLDLMARSPQKFKDAILISGAYNHTRKIIKWYNRFASYPLIKRILPIGLRKSNDEMYALKDELIKLEKILPKVKSKVHLIHGVKDKIVPVDDSTWLHEKLSQDQQGKLIISPKDNHFIIWKNKDLIKEAIFSEI